MYYLLPNKLKILAILSIIWIAHAAYYEHPILGATIPKYTDAAKKWFCATNHVCVEVTSAYGWYAKYSANLDCGIPCKDYNASLMTDISNWIECTHATYDYMDRCGTSIYSKYNYCNITFPYD